jgi:hypothetical protein
MPNINFLQESRKDFPLLFSESNPNLVACNIKERSCASTRKSRLKKDGYFEELSGVADYKAEIASLAEYIKKLDELSLSPVLSFYTDFSWALFRSLDDIFRDVLDEDYMILPDFWAWYINPHKNDSGWTPHRDKAGRQALFDDGSPKSLTCWIPLTEADPLNGCMYVIPKQYDKSYGVDGDSGCKIDNLNVIRALPANPGTVIVWDQTVMHWGAKSSEFAERPRISIALEVQSSQVAPFNMPLLSPKDLLFNADKLKLIGKQMIQYKHMYPLSLDNERLAISLMNGIDTEK